MLMEKYLENVQIATTEAEQFIIIYWNKIRTSILMITL